MGCLFSLNSEEAPIESAKKEYSWDKRKNIRVEDFTLDGIKDRTVVRLPNSIAGQQFIIQNCTNCKIYLLDHCATVTIDKCTDCQVVTGPIKGSIFLRNCKNCKVLCACQQFRTRDCSKTDVFLFCMTQPIIEVSYKMRFGCYQLSYDGLDRQFRSAGLEAMNNTWSTVFDFTPNPDEGPNWGLIPETTKIEDVFSLNTEHQDNGEGDNGCSETLNKEFLPDSFTLKIDIKSSIVPMTNGNRSRASQESCLVLIFHHDRAVQAAMDIIHKLHDAAVLLIRSSQLTLPEETALQIFNMPTQSAFLKAGKRGSVIGLEFNGEECSEKCHHAAGTIPDGLLIFISDSKQCIEQFYMTNDMQMM